MQTESGRKKRRMTQKKLEKGSVWEKADTVTLFIVVLMTPLVPVDRISHLSGIAEIWVLSNMGVLASFIGFNQLAKRGEKKNDHIER